MKPERIKLYQDHQLTGIPVMNFPRVGDLVDVGLFPMRFSEHILLTESGLWTLWMYRGELVKRRERG